MWIGVLFKERLSFLLQFAQFDLSLLIGSFGVLVEWLFFQHFFPDVFGQLYDLFLQLLGTGFGRVFLDGFLCEDGLGISGFGGFFCLDFLFGAIVEDGLDADFVVEVFSVEQSLGVWT